MKIAPEKFYEGLAEDYDQLAESSVAYLKESEKLFAKYGHSQGTVLDIGCGTGLFSTLLGNNFQFTGVEPCESMAIQARDRGYQIIGKKVEQALAEIPDMAYDFVVALGCLFYVEDISSVLKHIQRIAKQSFIVTLDDLPQAYIDDFSCQVYNHYNSSIPHAIESYRSFAWQSPTLGTDIYCKVIYGIAPSAFKPTLVATEPFYYAKKYAKQYNCDLAIASNVGLGSLVCFSPLIEAMSRQLGRQIKLLTTSYKHYQNRQLDNAVPHPVWLNNPYISEIVDADKIDFQISFDLLKESHNFCQSKHNIENMLNAYNLRPARLHGDLYLSSSEMAWAIKQLAHLPRPVIAICPDGTSASLESSPWYKEKWSKLIRVLNGKASFVQLGSYGFKDKEFDIFKPKTTIRQLMALVWASDLYVGFDGGVSHIASAFEVPSVVLWDAVRKVELEEDKCEGFSTAMMNRWAYPQNENLVILGETNDEIFSQCVEFIIGRLATAGFNQFSLNQLIDSTQ